MGIDTLRRRAVFLDRDGVLNRAFVRDGVLTPPRNLEELEILPGVRPALEQLRRAGLQLIVVTNQPDVARGRIARQAVEQIHARLRSELPLDDLRVCFHDDADGCDCRKPKPGMLVAAAQDLRLDLAKCYMIGDSWRDIEAAHRAGCRMALIGAAGLEEGFRPDIEVNGLPEAAQWILACEQSEAV